MGKVTISFVWAFIQKFGNTFLSFISNIILARLLLPEDYGAIGMIMIFIVISNTFIDGGFGSALIQKTNPTTKDYSTIFYWNIFFSIGLYIVLYFCAPFIASFYKLPLLNNLLKVLGVVLIINSLSVVQSTQLRKKLKFKECAYATVISSLLAVCVTIFLAYNGMGVWSLVIQQILVSVFSFLLYLYFNKWIPSLVFSWKSLKELFNFGFFMLCSSFLNNLCNNIQGLLVKDLWLGCCIAFRREILLATLPFPKKAAAHDLWIALYSQLHFKCGYYPKVLQLYRRHENTVSFAGGKSTHKLLYRINYRLYLVYHLLIRSIIKKNNRYGNLFHQSPIQG